MCYAIYKEGWNDNKATRAVSNFFDWDMWLDKVKVRGLPYPEHSFWPSDAVIYNPYEQLTLRQKWDYFWLPSWCSGDEGITLCAIPGDTRFFLYERATNRFVKHPHWGVSRVDNVVMLHTLLQEMRFKDTIQIVDQFGQFRDFEPLERLKEKPTVNYEYMVTEGRKCIKYLKTIRYYEKLDKLIKANMFLTPDYAMLEYYKIPRRMGFRRAEHLK